MKVQLTSDWLRNVIRTIVPSGLGGVITYFITKWFPNMNTAWIQNFTHGGWYALLMTASTGVYYGAFRWLETKFKWASAFLGAKPVVHTVMAPMPAPAPVSTFTSPAV